MSYHYFGQNIDISTQLIDLGIISSTKLHENRETRVVIYSLIGSDDKKYILKIRHRRDHMMDAHNSDEEESRIWIFLHQNNLAPELIRTIKSNQLFISVSVNAGYSFDKLYDSITEIPNNLKDDILVALNKLHSLSFIHGDLDVQNTLLSGVNILFIDFEKSFFVYDVDEGRLQYLNEFLGIEEEYKERYNDSEDYVIDSNKILQIETDRMTLRHY